jgi:hypothetical protein
VARWRPAAARGAAGELLEWAGELEWASGTDPRAAGLLVSAWSWLAMLGETGNDREIGELFCEFARADRAAWRGARGG